MPRVCVSLFLVPHIFIYTSVYIHVCMISVRVDEGLKEKMGRYPQINWSEYIRENVERRVREEEMREASEVMDELSAKTDPRWSGAREIRRWRSRDE